MENTAQYHYMREAQADDYGILELQEKILEIAVYIDQICRDNQIEYCLMGGSALGAVRHGGFIPWDDDMDIFMTPENYARFREVFKASANLDKYYLQEWGAEADMVKSAKVRMNGTAYIESVFQKWDMHHGVFVDIFILHNCPSGKIKQLYQCIWAKYIVMKGLAVRDYNRRGGVVSLVLSILRCFPDRMLVSSGLKHVYRYNWKDTVLCCHFLGKAVFRKGIYKKRWFENCPYVQFENVMLKVPSDIDAYLSCRFGDYMKLPSKEGIQWGQHAQYWNTQKDYTEVLPHCTAEHKDERKLL